MQFQVSLNDLKLTMNHLCASREESPPETSAQYSIRQTNKSSITVSQTY